MSKNNVVDLSSHKLNLTKSKHVSEVESPQTKGSVNISKRLRSTIDDGLKQQMRDQMRKKHGIGQ
jgi:hypothetical protein